MEMFLLNIYLIYNPFKEVISEKNNKGYFVGVFLWEQYNNAELNK